MYDDSISLSITSFSEEVTGSNNHVMVRWPDGREVTFLVDCGLFQEPEHNHLNTECFGYNPQNIDFVLVTHTHTDHIGRLPYLVKKGFGGPIYSSYETAKLMPTVLNETLDRLQSDFEKGVKKYKQYKLNLKLKKLSLKGRGRKDKPRRENTKKQKKSKKNKSKETEKIRLPRLLYEKEDVHNTTNRVVYKNLSETFIPFPGVEVTFYPNAHIAGPVITVCRLFDEKEELYVLFTGDLGFINPITNVTTFIPDDIKDKINVIVSESTYGSSADERLTEKERKEHKAIIRETVRQKGTIMYMSNSLERPLRLGVDIKEMQKEEDMKSVFSCVDIFFDSTFGIQCLNKYIKLYGKDYLPDNFTIIDKMSRKVAIQDENPKMIICTSPRFYQGSFLNYGKRMLEDPNVVLIFVAYIPENVRNIIALPRGTKIEFMGEEVILRCKMYQFGYYSSHVSPKEMDEFMSWFKNSKVILFNHGTHDSKINFMKRYKRASNTTHNLLYGKTVIVTKDGIRQYF